MGRAFLTQLCAQGSSFSALLRVSMDSWGDLVFGSLIVSELICHRDLLISLMVVKSTGEPGVSASIRLLLKEDISQSAS